MNSPHNPYFSPVSKFRLIIDSLYFFRLSKRNYRSIIGNDILRYKVTLMIEEMERGGFYGIVKDNIQIDRI